jgi:beta-lactam-binding protein with PASTA domain
VQVASDKPIGTVVKVSPTGLLPVTTAITITVSSGPAATTPPPTSTGGTGG